MSYIPIPSSFKPWKKQSFLNKKLSSETLSWLLDKGSLTKRLINYCHKSNSQFHVEVIQQKMSLPVNNEAQKLNIGLGQWAYIREVLLYCSDEPIVYARTVIPYKTMTGRQQQLKYLKNKPLGAYLFSQPDLKRDPIEISQIWHNDKHYWARRSCFYLQKKPLLVYETFLKSL